MDARPSGTQRIELTDAELRLVRTAVEGYLAEFGHEEPDVLHELKALLNKLPKPSS